MYIETEMTFSFVISLLLHIQLTPIKAGAVMAESDEMADTKDEKNNETAKSTR